MSEIPCAPKTEKIDGIDKYEVEDAARTLQRAFEVRSNPKLFAAATKVLRKNTLAAQKALKWSDKIK